MAFVGVFVFDLYPSHATTAVGGQAMDCDDNAAVAVPLKQDVALIPMNLLRSSKMCPFRGLVDQPGVWLTSRFVVGLM
jgi:hypothetical protein